MKRLPRPAFGHRATALVLACIFVVSAAVSGTMAWADFSQHRTNAAEGSGPPQPGSALLQKYETDTESPVPGVEFTLYQVNADGTATPVASYITGADGQILASELGPGEYYWQETRPANGYLPEIEDGQVKKYYVSLPTEDGEPVLSIAYNTRRQGSLALTKIVENADNSPLSQAQKDMLFEFTVTFLGETQKIYLKSGETKQFELPVGTHYVIAETPVLGYVTTSENSAGNVPEDGITATFTNTYAVTPPGYGNLTVTKTVVGEGADPDQAFPFSAVIGDHNEIFTLKHGESRTFSDIPLGTAYNVSELSVPAFYAPNHQQYSGTITTPGLTITLPFTNHYEGDNPPDLPGALEITKSVTGPGASQEKAFIFTITFEGEGAPQSPQTFPLKHGEIKLFEDIPQGVTYTVTEQAEEGYRADFTSASGTISWDQKVTVRFVNRTRSEPRENMWLIVTKRVLLQDNPPADDGERLFHFTLTINETKYEFDLMADESSDTFVIYPGDVYNLVEDDYIAYGYIQSGLINGSGTVGEDDIEAIQTNTYIGPVLIDIEGEKQWQAPAGTQRPESVTIRLMNGNVIVQTAETNQVKNWRYEFTNLPKYDALGSVIPYTVEELRMPGWRPVVTDFDIENHHQPPVTDEAIEVEKAVTGTPPEEGTFQFILTALNNAPMPDSDEITITGAGKAAFGPIDYTMPGVFTYTITETDGKLANWSYDASVYTLTVTVTEDEEGQLIANRELTKAGQPAEKAIFTNRYDESGEMISVKVTKVWQGEGPHPQSVQVQLYKDGTLHDTATLSSANNWTRTWPRLEKGHTWTMDEVNVPEGYVKTVSGDAVNGFTVTNTFGDIDETTSVKVTKVWKGEDPDRPAGIAVQLYKDGAAEGVPVILSEQNQWKYTWTQLEKGPAYTADEVNVPAGYSKAVTGDAANGFVVTNTKKPGQPPSDEEITLSGKKTWNHGANPESKWPQSITVIVRADGAIVTQRLISAKEHWAWSFRLPRFNAQGGEIKYSVDEIRFYDYVKTVDGTNLINTYSPGGNTDDGPAKPGQPGKPTGPQTDDKSDLALWLALMGLSLGGLAAVIILSRRQQRRKRKAR
ncbi:MAG: Cna B-type domain-containing protein [Oscillospiraceae bacterium]|nr:Cna B-type domain-containing protein [Oscillospiraceae bacterium]